MNALAPPLAPRPICFMVMPYGTKPTGAAAGKGPTTIDFDALWNKVYRPLIEDDLGYEAVRGDEEISPLILDAMIESLALSDLVIADISIPNANVYYEIGLRHGARPSGCVLVTADWATPAFDLGQVRHVRFPLPDGTIPESGVGAMREALRTGILHQLTQASVLHAVLPGFPDSVDDARTARFRDRVDALHRVGAELAAVRVAERARRRELTLAARDRYAALAATTLPIALELIALLRDVQAWTEMRSFIESLPADMQAAGVVQEQRCLALSKLGDSLGAVTALQELIRTKGETSERRGLLGGRFKALWKEAVDPRDQAQYLDRAIEEYSRGMQLDLNDYFPMSNLPRLLRTRAEDGDDVRAQEAAAATVLGCRRALELNPTDEWIRPTLLGAAFDAGNVAEAKRLAAEVRRSGAAGFPLATTLSDLEQALALHPDTETRERLTEVVSSLRALL